MLTAFLFYYIFGLGITTYAVYHMPAESWRKTFDRKIVIVITLMLYPVLWPYYAWDGYKERRDARLRGRR